MAKVEFWEEAVKDYRRLDGNLKQWVDVAQKRLEERGSEIGKPLHNNSYSNLAGMKELKYDKLGIRLIFKVSQNDEIEIVEIIVIGARDEGKVFRTAETRRQKRE